MLIGKLNVLEVSIGERGYGKSTWQSYRTLRLQRETGGYVLGHSLGGRLPSRLPPSLGGAELPIKYEETIDGLRKGLRWSPEKWHIVAPRPGYGATADDVLRFADDMSTQVRETYWRQKHWGQWKHHRDHSDVDAPPIIVDIDEGIASKAAGHKRNDARDENRWFSELLVSLRHMHIAVMWSLQDPTLRTWRIMQQATDIYVFHLEHQYVLNALEAAGAKPEQLERIPHLAVGEHVQIKGRDLDWRRAQNAIEKSLTGSAQRPDAPTISKP